MRHKAQDPKLRVIRASELGEYSYCSRAWWYRHVLKIAPPAAAKPQAGSKPASKRTTGTAEQSPYQHIASIGIALALFGLLALALALVAR